MYRSVREEIPAATEFAFLRGAIGRNVAVAVKSHSVGCTRLFVKAVNRVNGWPRTHLDVHSACKFRTVRPHLFV